MRTHLIGFLASEKRQTLVEAVRRKALAVIGDVDLRIGLKARSLQMPLDELERRLWLLNQQVDEARRQRIIVADSLAGERRRAVERLYAQAEEVRKRVGASLRTAVEQFIATVDDPTVFTRPWTMRVVEKRRPDEEVWESACWEGNTNPDSFLQKGDSAQKSQK